MPPSGYIQAALKASEEKTLRRLAERENTTVARLAGLLIREALERRREAAEAKATVGEA